MFIEMVIIFLVVSMIKLIIRPDYIREVIDNTIEFSDWIFFKLDISKNFAV